MISCNNKKKSGEEIRGHLMEDRNVHDCFETENHGLICDFGFCFMNPNRNHV